MAHWRPHLQGTATLIMATAHGYFVGIWTQWFLIFSKKPEDSICIRNPICIWTPIFLKAVTGRGPDTAHLWADSGLAGSVRAASHPPPQAGPRPWGTYPVQSQVGARVHQPRGELATRHTQGQAERDGLSLPGDRA